MARFENIPDVDFTGGFTVGELKEIAENAYNEKYRELTGRTTSMPERDRAILWAAVQIFYQLMQTDGEKAKQNLLKYATGKFLDNLALSAGLTRKAEENAIVAITFSLAAARDGIVPIPEGTRVTSGARKIYFATNDYAEIAPGELSVSVECTSLTGGSAANDFKAGDLNVLADPIAYIASVGNSLPPTGGRDEESDDIFAQRIFDSRYLNSTTGAEAAYIYHIKDFSSSITDVKALNPQDADLEFYILLEGAEEASEAFINELTDHISDPRIKALTDKITVLNAPRISYSINVSYGIGEDDISRIAQIQADVAAAVKSYRTWQSERIGRDIDTQELLRVMKNAGAKNIVIQSPVKTVIANTHVAVCSGTTISYTGVVYN